MQKGQYIVIKVADIKKAIEEKNLFGLIKSALSSPTDLYDVVEDAYDDGWKDLIYKGEDYLNNLEI